MSEINTTTVSFQAGVVRRQWHDLHPWSEPSLTECAEYVMTATPDKVVYTVKRVLLEMTWTGNRDVDAPRVRANVKDALLRKEGDDPTEE